jgi:hypothetical protein
MALQAKAMPFLKKDAPPAIHGMPMRKAVAAQKTQ